MKRIDTPEVLLETVRREFERMFLFPDHAEIELLKNSENLTFTVSSPVRKAVLRVNRPGYHTKEELLAELQWMEQIRRGGKLIVPQAFPGRNGSLLQSFRSPESGVEYDCSLFSFLPGKAVCELHGQQLLDRVSQVGAAAAILHTQVQKEADTARFRRFTWDFESLLGENARWGSWSNYPGLTQKDRILFRQASTIIEGRLSNYGKEPDRYGLIHSDLHLSNVIMDGEKLQIIDFDDCGFGWFLYDLGCSLVQYSDGLEELCKAWLQGYQTVRCLSLQDFAEIPTFVLMRRIVRLAWLGSHGESDTAKTVGTEYLEKTRRMAYEFVRRNVQKAAAVC
ncbi:phosphotransferase enzyme family protein [Caproiciproducens sp. R1]|uniref:phosphotransferase enzyme family protein n=1 Tax=Caproiciproducens sp. R1 TaxID=3435000 RepID=UPI0040346909